MIGLKRIGNWCGWLMTTAFGLVVLVSGIACDEETKPFQKSECVNDDVYFEMGPILFSVYEPQWSYDGYDPETDFYLSGQTEYEYDGGGRLIHRTTKSWDPFEGNPLTVERRREYVYDDFGRLEKVVLEHDYPPDVEDEWTMDYLEETRYLYDEQDRLVKVESYRELDGEMELQTYSEYVYGENGRVSRYNYNDYEYDEDGRLVRENDLDWNGEFFEIDPTRYKELDYDSRGRLSKRTTTTFFPELDDWIVQYEIQYKYNAETFDLTEVISTSHNHYETGEYSSRTTNTIYERDGSTITSTYDDGGFGEGNVIVIDFSDEGSSYAWSNGGPTPPNTWPFSYGTGYINGCVDL